MAAGSAKPFGGTIGKTVAGSKPWWPQAAKPPEGASKAPQMPASGKMPAAGPHDQPHLTNPDATPGTGSLPESGEHDATNSTSS